MHAQIQGATGAAKNPREFNSHLSPGNEAFKGALVGAIAAIYWLDAAGSTVTDIDIRGGTPVLRIDRPPPFVKGVDTVRRNSGGHRQIVRAAPYHGAQIEWVERELRQPTHRVAGGA